MKKSINYQQKYKLGFGEFFVCNHFLAGNQPRARHAGPGLSAVLLGAGCPSTRGYTQSKGVVEGLEGSGDIALRHVILKVQI